MVKHRQLQLMSVERDCVEANGVSILPRDARCARTACGGRIGSTESRPTTLVAERPHEGSRGLQPTVPPGRGPRRGATLEHRMKSGRSLSRRSATRFPSGSIRGLKSTATVTLSLRENPPVGRAGFRPEGPSFNIQGQSPRFRSNKGPSPERAEQHRCVHAWFRPFRAGSNWGAIPGLRPGLTNCAPLGLSHGPLFASVEHPLNSKTIPRSSELCARLGASVVWMQS